MEYSSLVSALESSDSGKVNELLKDFYPRLLAFLRLHMNADTADAEDCAQDTIVLAMDAVREGRVKDPDRLVPYILTICKNIYLKQQRNRREEFLEDIPAEDDRREGPRQLEAIFDEEQKRLLEWCLKQLKESHRVYMRYWFDNPDAHTNKVAKHFKISTSNAWTRKHRLIKKLNECYRKKSKL